MVDLDRVIRDLRDILEQAQLVRDAMRQADATSPKEWQMFKELLRRKVQAVIDTIK